jgi:PAS domain-containing protein
LRKSRYETAFIENDLCGALPIRIGKGPKNEPEFRFREMDGSKHERVYRLIQTVVRPIREEGDVGAKHSSAKTKKRATAR